MNAQNPPPPQGNPKPQPQPQPQQKAEPDKPQGAESGGAPEPEKSDLIGGSAADPLGEEALPGAAAAASRIYRSTVSQHGTGTLISSGSVTTMNVYGRQPTERLLAGPHPAGVQHLTAGQLDGEGAVRALGDPGDRAGVDVQPAGGAGAGDVLGGGRRHPVAVGVPQGALAGQ
ncbi:hypothetical protein ABZ372_52375, partial [Streptomyces sp. NPDC005921]